MCDFPSILVYLAILLFYSVFSILYPILSCSTILIMSYSVFYSIMYILCYSVSLAILFYSILFSILSILSFKIPNFVNIFLHQIVYFNLLKTYTWVDQKFLKLLAYFFLNIRRNYLKLVQSTKLPFYHFSMMFEWRSTHADMWRHHLMMSCNREKSMLKDK